MLPRFLSNFLCLPVIAMSIYSVPVWAGGDDELKQEEKPLQAFSLDPYAQEVSAMNACFNEDDLPEFSLTKEEHQSLRRQMQKRYLQEEAAKTPEQKAEEERQRQDSNEKLNEEIKEIEDGILVRINQFIDTHPADKEKMSEILEAGDFSYGTDFCDELGNYFWKQKRYDDADYFYDEAGKSADSYSQNYSQSSKARMHLEQYNQELIVARPDKPTPSMFHNLQQTIWAFYEAAYCNDEVAEIAVGGVVQVRNHLVRWYLSKPYISRNIDLKEIAYADGFVDRILKQAQAFRCLMTATRYDGSMQDYDLTKHLKKLGFHGILQSDNQHNWVRQDGFMIRVKRANYNDAQLTIGITARSPLVWDANGEPIALATYARGEHNVLGNNPRWAEVAFDEDNEVFKLAYNNVAVSVVPSRIKVFDPRLGRKVEVRNRWNQFAACGEMMGLSHFEIPDGFGDVRTHNTRRVKKQLLPF